MVGAVVVGGGVGVAVAVGVVVVVVVVVPSSGSGSGSGGGAGKECGASKECGGGGGGSTSFPCSPKLHFREQPVRTNCMGLGFLSAAVSSPETTRGLVVGILGGVLERSSVPVL